MYRQLAALGGALLAATSPAAIAPPDTIFVNGLVYTPTGMKQAFAVKGNRIIAVGDDGSIARLAGPKTEKVDLRGSTVLPGLADMHVHPLGAGLASLQCRIAQGATSVQFLDTVRACVRQKSPGEWITGRAWQAGSMGAVPINRQTLDAIAPDNPVALLDTSGHSMWVNSKALSIAGIVSATPNPDGGIIERDGKGAPTGLLRENAKALIQAHIPSYDAIQNAAALKRALDKLLSQGVTTINDASLSRPTVKAYVDLADRGELKQRVIGCFAYKIAKDFDQLLADRKSSARANFSPSCVKVWVDGVPTEGHTGAMVEPYADADAQPNAPARGLVLIPPAELKAAVTRWDKLGLLVKFHVAGDQAVRSALDAIEATRRTNGPNGPRHMLAHASFVTVRDMARARPLRTTWEFGPYIWYPSPISNDVAKAVGPERMQRAWPIKDGIASGAVVVAGSDWPIVPDANPWIGIETSITRKRPGGVGESLGGGQAITIKQAIDMYTINAARALGEESDRGSIESGKIADFIILDRNPFAIPVTQIGTTKVRSTFIGGNKVFDGTASN